MKNTITLTLLLYLLLSFNTLHAQDTFSIVAVDSITGEVGSAGASCIDERAVGVGVIVISDVKPGRGAINSQSFLNFDNQRNAGFRMNAGDSPENIISWLIANDVENDPSVRQYGIADFDPDGRPRATAFTGQSCFDFKGQRVGSYYAIQGNILLGPEILDAMETQFLKAEGDLADRLMAAMQGANVVGADRRCLEEGVSSLSAYIEVAKPSDDPDNLWLSIDVPSTPFGVEPIDVLQERYDEWKSTISSTSNLSISSFEAYPNPTTGAFMLKLPQKWLGEYSTIVISNSLGQIVYQQRVVSEQYVQINDNTLPEKGIYNLQIINEQGVQLDRCTIVKE